MLKVAPRLLLGAALAALPALAMAQDSGIAGVVTDATGGVLPGVTVDAASPSLIEGSRVAVTDGEGRYSITALRPGVYRVTFTLPGFSTVIREGVELTAQFTANINAELRVGAIEESVTVTGATPVVDVQNVVQREVVTKDRMDALPMMKNWSSIGVLVPALTTAASSWDVGGTSGEEQNYLAAHGGSLQDGVRTMDGMVFSNFACDYSCTGVSSNDASTQELSYEYAGNAAESPTGGVRVNIIPKEGGNTLSGSAFGNLATEEMAGDNFSAALKEKGVLAPDGVHRLWDTSAALGGPLKRDALWFFTAHRYWGNKNLKASAFWEKNPFDHIYDPDLTRQALDDQWNVSDNIRFTYQISQKNKASVYFDNQPRCQCHWNVNSTRQPEASSLQRLPVNYHWTATWTATLSSRLLLESGFSDMTEDWTRDPVPDAAVDPATGRPVSEGYPYTELTTNVNYRAYDGTNTRTFTAVRVLRSALSYVTGSHAFKAGVNWHSGPNRRLIWTNNDTALRLRAGVPVQVVVRTTPYTTLERLNADLGIFAQDTWTIRRLTLNLGARYEYLNAMVEAQDTTLWFERARIAGGGTWIGPRQFAEIRDLPNWHDLSPRVGASYDLFGTGKTAIKGSINRYVDNANIAFAAANNPLNTTVNNTTRAWTDLNGDFIPQVNELGPLTARNFGQVSIATRSDEALRTGWHKRRYNWEGSVAIQHEVMPRVSAEVAYFRRWQGNFQVVDNLDLAAVDYDPFCFTAPRDARLPGGGGNQLCGLYDIKQAKFGTSGNSLRTFADPNTRTEVFDGVDFTADARPTSELFVTGGVALGRTAIEDCQVVDSPEAGRPGFCDYTTPWQPRLKVSGAYTLPWYSVQVAGSFQSVAGPEIRAIYNAPVAEITPFLGRPLAGSQRSRNIELIPRGTLFDQRLNQVDIRFTKIFRLADARRLEVMFDGYNMLNSAAPLIINTTYGPRWLEPTDLLVARFFKVGGRFTF